MNNADHLWNGVSVADHVHNVIQGQEGVTLDLREDVFAHRAARQQPHQLDVVPQVRAIIHPKKFKLILVNK